jgi:acyl-CoA dehydrogenase
MTVDTGALEEGVTGLLRDHCAPERLAAVEGRLDRQLWDVLHEAGLDRVGVPESAGGSGGSLIEAAVILRLVGMYAASVPLAETSVIAGPVLAAAGLTLPDGVVTVGLGDATAEQVGGGWRLAGTLHRVAYGGAADATVGVATCTDGQRLLFVTPVAAPASRSGRNVAGEPRDDISVDHLVPDGDAVPVPHGVEEELRTRGALSRAILVAGATQAALEMTVRYARERQQFGRPIAAFQAVQQQIAALAGEAAAARAAVDAAVRICAAGFTGAQAGLAVAAAKVRTAQAAGSVAAIAHQVHGAIGMTQEHPLRFTTTRLWAWRSEWGGEREWSQRIGAAAVGVEEDGLWPMLVGT